MKNTLSLLSLVVLFASYSSCQKEFLDPNDSAIIYDADAKRFIDSSGITSLVEKSGVNDFVKALKDSFLWDKFMAVYPMVGGTASTAMWNLKDPRNSDAAFRLSFSGSPVFASSGVLFPTISDYADTHLPDDGMGGATNAAISYYSRTQNTVSGYDMGCTDGAIPYNELSIYSNSADKSEWFGFSEDVLSPNTTGLFMLSSSVTDVSRYRNGVVVSSKGSTPLNKYTGLTILIGVSRVTIHPGQKECALATIGSGLNNAQALTFYNIVQKFESALGR